MEENRRLYRRKSTACFRSREVFDVQRPAGGFYVWLQVGGDDEQFTAGLFASQNVTVVPGSYLGRETSAGNPGAGFIRISLVASEEECVQAARRIRDYAISLRET